MLDKLKKWQKKFLVIALSAIVVFWLVLPAVVEWYIESNSKELTGRQILMDDLDLNVLTGGVTFQGFKFFEADDSTVFFQAAEIYVDLEYWQNIFGTYGLGAVMLVQPQITILQTGTSFNFDDLMVRFTSDTASTPGEEGEPLRYQVRNIVLSDGTFTYRQQDLQAELKMIRINSNCPLISSDDPNIDEQFDLAFDQGGKLKGVLQFDMNTMAYRTTYTLDSLNIGILFPYVAAYMRAGKLGGLFSSHQTVAGNLNNPTNVAMKGISRLHNFVLTDAGGAKLAGVDDAVADIDTVNLGAGMYEWHYIKAIRPYLIIELFDEGNNFSRLMAEPSETAEAASDSLAKAAAYGNVFALIAESIKEMSHLYAFSDYHADSLVMRQGTLVFNDFTLHQRFNYLLEDLIVKADKVSSDDENIKVDASSVLNTSGILKGTLLVDPHALNNMQINYSISGLRVMDFNPYSDYYVAHPFTDGVCYYVSSTSVKDQYLKSNHVLDIKSIKVGKKVKNETAYNIPVRLAVALLRDKNGKVHLELPIEGDLNNPKYKLGKIIWQVLGNLVSKAVAAPGKLLAGKAGVEEALLQGFTWNPLQTELSPEQTKSLDALVKSMETTPEILVDLVNLTNTALEGDELAVREGKKKFLFHHKRISSEDPVHPIEQAEIEKVHRHDSTFNDYLNQQVKAEGELLSVYEKSRRLTGKERLQVKLNEIYLARTNAVVQYLTTVKNLPQERFRFTDPTEPKQIPYAELSAVTFKFCVDDN